MIRVLLLFFIIFTYLGYSQTDGITYQAVIIDPYAQEIPGADISGNFLPNVDLQVRFTILDENDSIEFQEVHSTSTDTYGMINLIIGQGVATFSAFTEILWYGNPKDLKVEINLDGSFSNLSQQPLLFVPYAYHRDIIASGDLFVSGNSFFEGDVTIEGITNLNNDLFVNNASESNLSGTLDVNGATTLNNTLDVTNGSATNLSGTLSVEGETTLNNTLGVNGATTLNNTLDVTNGSATNLSGTLSVEGETTLNNTLDVNGATTLNNTLDVTNGSATNLSGTLTVEGETTLNNTLDVNGATTLNNTLDVTNGSATNLSGTLTVEGETTLNNTLDVNGATTLNNTLDVTNGSATNLSGTLTVEGETTLNNTLDVNGATTLNNTLDVTNGSATNLSGTLTVEGETTLNNTLDVNGATTLNNTLDVTNGSATNLSGTLAVEGETTLNNTLDVTNGSATNLSGTLTVEGETVLNNTLDVNGATTLNNTLDVTNGSATNLSGTLTVEGETTLNNTLDVNGATTLNNTLDVTNGSATNLSGTLAVEGETTLNNTLGVNGATTLNDNLDVLGETNLEGLSVKTLNITTNNTEYIATLSNTNGENGDGMLIKLGRTHGAWNGNGYLNIPNPFLEMYSGQLNAVEALLDGNGGSLGPEEILALAPTAFVVGGIGQLTNLIIENINDGLDLPIGSPAINFPSMTLFNGYTVWSGGNYCVTLIPEICLEICYPDPTWEDPLNTSCYTECTPAVESCVNLPSISLPSISVPGFELIPSFPTIIPEIPELPIDGLPTISSPNFNFNMVNNSLTSENKYITFQDKDGRQTGAIKAMSSTDFRNNTVLDDIYLLNVLSSFVGIDLLDGVVSGTVSMSNIIDEYNSIGVEYASGHGDYAEWLERLDQNEYLSPGDIVAVKGGKISKTIEDFEQLMVVSHKPIVLGNVPQEDQLHLGNNVAFMGQVPVKVMGPVEIGDYIIAHEKIKGYGRAISPDKMTANQFKKAVGRAWEKNNLKGPKLINTVVGIHNGDWKNLFENLMDKQNKIENDLESIEKKILKIKLLKLKKKSLALKTND